MVSISRPQLQRGFRLSWKLSLNLCSRRWLGPSLNIVTNLIPFQLWHWEILLGEGNINFKILFLKTLKLAECWKEGSSLFHSEAVDEKNVFLKKSSLWLKKGVLATCLVWYALLRLVLVRSSNQEFVHYEFYKNSIVSYTIVAVEETLNLAFDTTFSLSYL